ncbi:UNVERIFIED_CONTAM: hypothetical protein Scaly_1189500 [Sesamum calycinum]|uniref:DUF4218 domain-containing protein n=1 Tax=Sesamum calycinum TaxID=2727403 RepID=A0AAW2Q3N9_9LAMI
MHIEKNVFENIFNTVMDIKGKTKDNLDTRRDLKSICNRPELKLDERRSNVIPKVVYTLGNEQKKVCEWIRGLKFPDRYASNLACCVNMMELRMHGMKSYNCHVLQKLIPIAFRKMLPEHVWSALTKVSLLLQTICSTTLDVHKLHELENSVAIILGNLEKIFSSVFFNSIEHLIVHLPYEAHIGGPVQYSTLSWTCNPNEACLEEMMSARTTMMDSRVCVKSSSYTDEKNDFYGIIKEIIQLFKCCWVDSIRGMKVHPSYHLIDVNFKKLYQKDDPFILAQQAVQARRVVDDSKWTETGAYQPKEVVPVPIVAVDNQSYNLRDPNGVQVVLEAAGTSRR